MTYPEHFSLSYITLLIRLRCWEPARLPMFLGSVLHGVIGWKLSNFVTPAYRYLFENRRYGGGKFDIVNPYIIEPPRRQELYHEGDLLSFRFILVGDSQTYLRKIVEGLVCDPWYELGAWRKKFKLVDIMQAERLEPIWRDGELNMESAVSEKLNVPPLEFVSRCSVHLLTPLRIRRGGEHVREVDFPTLIRNISLRLTALAERYGGYVNEGSIAEVCQLSESAVRTLSSGLYWNELSRYSSRRNMKMDLSGLMGAMTFKGEMTPFVPWLHAAKVLHIGRNVTFGCGQLDVVFS